MECETVTIPPAITWAPDEPAPVTYNKTERDLLSVSNLDLDVLLNEVVRIAAQTLQVKACTVRLLDEDSGEMVLRAGYGLSHAYLSKGPVIAARSVFRELIEQCGHRGGVIESLDVSRDPRIQYAREIVAEGICSLLAAPLLDKGRVIGALSVYTAQPHYFTEQEVQTLQTIARHAAVAIHLAQFHQRQLELERIERELAIAAEIQSKLMPRQAPRLAGMDIAGWSHPCKEVGGDFYDFIGLPNDNLGIAVGDVSGKGIPAALLMAAVRTSLRVQAENVYGMHEIISRVNRTLYQDTRGEEFATLVYGVLDATAKVLTFVNAGHNNPLLFRGSQILPLEVGGVPLGIHPALDYTYREDRIQLLPGDLFVLYTDGFIDASNSGGEPFGEERFMEVIRAYRHLEAAALVRMLEEAVSRFTGGLTDYCDDRTVVVVKVLP